MIKQKVNKANAKMFQLIDCLLLAAARVIDGKGKTLLPGLIDSHTHIFGNGLQQSVQFGVTTNIDMFTSIEFVKAMKEQQKAGASPGRADLVSSGTAATVPGGHCTEYGLIIPTLSRSEEAQAFVDARIAKGLQADLLLVEGNPLDNIKDTRRIVGIWKEGVKLDRTGYLAGIARGKNPPSVSPKRQLDRLPV